MIIILWYPFLWFIILFSVLNYVSLDPFYAHKSALLVKPVGLPTSCAVSMVKPFPVLFYISNGDFDYKEVLFFFSSFYANPFHSSKIHSVFLLYSQLFIYSCSVVSVALKILLKILLIYIDVRVETILFTLGPTVSGPQERKLLHDLITESGYNRLKITL